MLLPSALIIECYMLLPSALILTSQPNIVSGTKGQVQTMGEGQSEALRWLAVRKNAIAPMAFAAMPSRFETIPNN